MGMEKALDISGLLNQGEAIKVAELLKHFSGHETKFDQFCFWLSYFYPIKRMVKIPVDVHLSCPATQHGHNLRSCYL